MLNTAVTVIVLLLALNGLLYIRQPGMIFFPMRPLVATPADWGLAYEDVRITTADDVQLHGWYLPRAGATHTLLFFHGNAGNISHRRDSIEIFHQLGLNVFILDYRGYGQSHGRPGEQGLYRDADAAWQYLVHTRAIDERNIIVFGRSLGGVVAARLAASVQPRGLIIESSFSSARAFAHAVFPLLSRVVILRYDFDTLGAIRQLGCPLLVVHSPDDEIMPYRLGQQIYQAAHEPKTFLTIRGDHNYGFSHSQPDYEAGLRTFLTGIPDK